MASRVPDEVEITSAAREPVTDPTLGIEVTLAPIDVAPQHRLVAIGDSLTHGFQSLAIHRTDLSYPALIARELGCAFDYPQYAPEQGPPLNLEYVIRTLEKTFGVPHWWQLGFEAIELAHLVDEIMRCWQVGPGANVPAHDGIYHNLGIYGWDVRDVLSRNADTEKAGLDAALQLVSSGRPGLGLNPLEAPSRISRYVALCSPLAALYVLEPARDGNGAARTPLQAAAAHGEAGGIETLIVFIGANNALGTVLDLTVHWSKDGYDDIEKKKAFNVWRPDHFAAELSQIAGAVRGINARHVIWGTVPHVTIAPLAHGVGAAKIRPGSRYFPYYTRPWIDDNDFNPSVDPHLTDEDARAIDSAIDQYNNAIVAEVGAARQDGKDWLLLDTCGLLDRVATRRYVQDPKARPAWWTPYELPAPVKALQPAVDSQFFRAGPNGRTCGGIFALDGVHPTTVGYGILAQEFINVMAKNAGVAFPKPNPGIDFQALVAEDQLLTNPPKSIGPDLQGIGRINELIDLGPRISAALRHL